MLRPLRVSQPTSVTEASAELARLGDEAKVYAGGTELIPLLRLGLVRYTHLVDIKRIPEVGELAWDGKVMHIGGAVTHRQLGRSPEVAEYLPFNPRWSCPRISTFKSRTRLWSFASNSKSL